MRIDLLRGLPREVGVLTAVSFTVALGFGIVAPVLPVFAKRFGVGATAAAAVISAFAFMRFISALGAGRLVDRVGERVLLATGIGVVAVSSALAGFSQSYVQLIVLRGVGGVGSALFTVSAINLVLRSAGPRLRGRATGAYQSGFIIGGITGPTLGSLLSAISIRAPFFVYAGTLSVAGTIAMVFLSRSRITADRTDDPPAEGAPTGDGPASSAEAPDEEPRVTLRQALRGSAYRAALTANLGTGWVFFGVRSALIPLFVVAALGHGTFWVGPGLAVVAATQAATLLPAGKLVDTYGRRLGMVGGALIATTSMLLLTFSPSLPTYFGAMVLLGAGASFLSVAPSAVVGDVAGGRSGTVAAAYQMSRDLGTIVGPLVAGAIAQQLSYGAAFGASAAVMAVVAALAAASRETRRTA